MTDLSNRERGSAGCGSDPGEGRVYINQWDGPPVCLDIEQAREFMAQPRLFPVLPDTRSRT